MFKFLLQNGFDITQRELVNGESIRDCIFRYCDQTHERTTLWTSLFPKEPAMIRAYKKHEARIMLEFRTRQMTSNMAKVAIVVRNFKFDQQFAKEAIRFTMQ